MSLFNLYWLYDLPNWLFGAVVMLFFVGYGLIGLLATRRWMKRQRRDSFNNGFVSYFLAAITVFYGITLGLLAVAAWTNFSATQDKVDREADAVASLYRDVQALPDPMRTRLSSDLRDYMREVIEVSWPKQKKGIVPYEGGAVLEQFETDLLTFEPQTERDNIVDNQCFSMFNQLIEARRSRLQSVSSGMPHALWTLVVLGGLITLTTTFFFVAFSFRLHVWMTVLVSAFLGLMIFLIGTLDNPYRGQVSIGPGSLQRVQDQLTRARVSALTGIDDQGVRKHP